MFLFETIQRESSIRFPMLGDWSIRPPASFSLFGREIYLYGIVVAMAFTLGILVSGKAAPKHGIRADDFYDMMIRVIPFSIVGARLYFVLFQLDYYLAYPKEIFAVWEGGLAIYGGIIAGLLTALVFCRRKGISFPAMLDVMSFGVLIGQAIGRWGNFFNREAFGAETTIFCRMGLTTPEGETVWVHPTFLYESLWNTLGFILLCIYSRRRGKRFDGELILFYFLWYGLGRSWIEGLRTDSLYLGGTGIRVSQLLSVLLVLGSCTILILKNKSLRGTKP